MLYESYTAVPSTIRPSITDTKEREVVSMQLVVSSWWAPGGFLVWYTVVLKTCFCMMWFHDMVQGGMSV